MTADRRRDELAGLLIRRGARVVHGPSLSTEYLHDDDTLRAATTDLIRRPPHAVVAVTGIGIRAWFQAADTWGSGDDLRVALASARILARGPKAAAAVSAAGLTVTRQAQNEQLDEIRAALFEEGVAGERVAVQLHGDDGLDLCAALRDAGAEVVEVPVYRWRPPADPAPALRLVEAACDRRLDAVVFTSAPAVRGLFALAATAGTAETLRAAFRGDLVAACVGPVCAAAAREVGVEAPVWPAVGRLGTLVRALSDHLAGRRREFMLTGVPVTLQGSLAVVDGETVELPARQRDVLEALAVEPGTLVARDALVQQVWGSAATAPHGLASTVARLRRRLGAAGRGIVSCRGQGYRLDPEPPVGQAREAPETGKRGHVSIVGAGPGDPGLITVRGLAALEAADVVVHDRLVHPDLLAGRVAVDVGKEPGHHPVPQEEINALVVGLARRGKRVVRLKGGDPFVFGRGAEEAQALASAGLDFDVVPAPTSALAALTYAGIPATDRRCGSSIAFVTGHCAAGRGVDWDRLADATDTLVVLMGLARLSEVVDRLLAGGRRPDCPAAVVSRGTLPDQRVVGAPLARIPEAVAETDLPGPALLVVGEVVRLAERIAWFGPERDQEMVTRMPGGGVPR